MRLAMVTTQTSTGSFRSFENLGDPTWWCLGDQINPGWNFKGFLEWSPRILEEGEPNLTCAYLSDGLVQPLWIQWSERFVFLQKMEGDRFVVMIRHTKTSHKKKKRQQKNYNRWWCHSYFLLLGAVVIFFVCVCGTHPWDPMIWRI